MDCVYQEIVEETDYFTSETNTLMTTRDSSSDENPSPSSSSSEDTLSSSNHEQENSTPRTSFVPLEDAELLNWKPNASASNLFLRVTWPADSWAGRLSNQLIAFLKSAWFALQLNRTLIIPNFQNPSNFSSYQKNSNEWYYRSPWDYFDWDRLSRALRIPIISETQFRRFFLGHIPEIDVDKNWTIAFQQLKNSAPVATASHWMFSVELPAEMWEPILWKHFWPSKEIASYVDDILNEHLKRNYTGIHLRNEEGYCVLQSGLLCKKFELDANCSKELKETCKMEPEYIAKVRMERSKVFQPLFLASDGQLPQTEKKLVDNGALMLDSFPKDFESMKRTCIDFWLLVNSDLFFRNPVSTLSINALAKRNTMGRTNNHLGVNIRLMGIPLKYSLHQ